ncbi:hypothetical protein MCOR02_010896 [Pyricularia oryzae]|uniref:Uncharacterized protein n=3 Tax=Pyricularia oryzae TaxID=318829 RepID=G4MZX9_PYRO7|nr:uncharacterized protein MGG_16766 [Pyricularia oryzae 70-15]ELQ42817.1 hypothetical protein OOU_Y34scaffold00192g1 [Pyricularia oryzae Y34]KAH9428338.1 hypothetical protein MCOR02_010896 [Pyricularia oryzae]EHA52217.1 hypothetical protein MGG_16766 [Pyricularia oryzae 70-15]KAI6306643.1 hypothetical protein MCOR34_007949 [Pyricularia oryzae]KAI6325191.1 hypothetical protein MCOR30_006847 [Pyricularia oryzae]
MGSTVEFGQRGKGSGQTPRPPVWSSKFQIQISSRTSGREWAIHATCAAVGTYLRSSYYFAADGSWNLRCHGGGV